MVGDSLFRGVAVALVAFGLSGCGSSGGGPASGTGGSSAGSGGGNGTGGTSSSGGSNGSGGGSGGLTAPDGGSGGAVVDSGSGTDGLADVAADTVGTDGNSSGLHGGTSGKYICPAGATYAGVMPALMGATTTIASFQMSNGEGPVWNPTANTFFHTSKMPTDQNSRQVWKVDLTAHTQTSIQMNVGDNGMSLDNDNKIVAADHKMSAIVRLDPTTGAYLETIADRYNGGYFQSPNDVIVRGDGNIYFSDPAYFSSQGKTPKTATTAFYRISPAKVVSVVEDDGTKDPNGVVLSADDNTLYTVVTGDKLVKKWSLNADGSINGAGTMFVRPKGNLPDGMCMDCAGNLYVGTQSGVEVYSPAGTMLTVLGTNAVNCSFGGADHKTLFVTTDTNVWYSGVNIPGLP